jgi:PAS domain S-box-containing protein
MSPTILSVDHDALLRATRDEVLRQAGFEVIEAATGAEALRLASEKQPALVVLAVALPGMDGFAVAKQLKSESRTASIPVLHVSNGAERSRDYPESLKSGAEAYLQSPIEPTELIAVVKAIIPASGGTAARKAETPAKDALPALIDAIPEEIWFADTERRFTLVNPSGVREFQLGAQSPVGVEELARSLEVYRADGSLRPLEEAPSLRALLGETVRDLEEIVRTPAHGELRRRQVSASPVRDAAGNIVGSVSVVHDVTAHRRAAEALRSSEERLRLAVDAAGLGTFEYRPATGECFWDAGAKALWGLPPDAEVVYAQVLERIHPEDRNRIREARETALTTDSPEFSEAEYRVIWPDGSLHWILDRSRTFFEGEGGGWHPDRMIAVQRDITESKRGDAALRESEGRLRLFVEHAPAAIALFDTQMRYMAASRRWMTDYSLGERDLTGRSHYEVFPEISERWKEIHRRCLAGAVEKCAEDPFPRANGELDWVRWEIHPWGDGKGEIGGIIIFSELITARKRSEEALRASEERYRTLFETMVEGFAFCEIVCDEAGKPCDLRYLSVNPAFERHTGVKAGDILGRTTLELFPQAEPEWFERFGKVALTGQPARFEGCFGPLERWFEVSAFQTQPGRFGVVFTDITERKRTAEALREGEAILRSFFDSPGMMRGIEEVVDGRIVHVSCNSAAAEMLGMERESIAGKSVAETGATEEAVRLWTGLYEESRRTGKPVSTEYSRLCADGREHWLLVTASYLGAGPSGNPRFGYTCLDFTDRKRAEEALRESEGRFRALVEASSDAVYRMNPDWSEMRQLRGRDFIADTEEPNRTWLQKYIHPDDQPRVTAAIAEAVRTRGIFELEHRVLRVDGTLGWTFSRAVPLQDANGEIVEWLGAASDITERKQAEEALRQSEKMYRAIGESIDYGVWVCTPDGRTRFVSESFLKLVGRTQEQCADFGWTDVLHPDDAERTVALWKECVRTEGRWDIEHRFRCVEGQWRSILARGVPVRDERGQIACWAGINLDISALKQIEESLRASESRERARAEELEALMDAAPAAIFVAHDPDCFSMTGNRMAYELVRRLSGSNLASPVSFRAFKDGIEIPAAELPVRKAASSGQPVRNFEFELVFEDGAAVNLLGDAVPLQGEDGRTRGAVGVFADITGLKRAEVRLREAQKLESLGLLAGGVAHDFNNLLVGVIGNASMAKEMLPPDHPASELMDGVLKAGEQAAHLTRQMLAYSGKGRFLVEAVDLTALVSEMCGLVRPSIAKKIALDLDLERGLPPVQADRGQIQQVFMNLALNAAEAIGSHEGRITVSTGVRDVDEAYMRLHPETAELQPGKYVSLAVRDTGCGMDEATRARIFDPFFSTKFTGRGLGLAAVAGILRGHKGAILVASEPGKGSCFTVLFAAAEGAAVTGKAAVRNVELQGSGVVLVVDDEKPVRELVRRVLERQGYTVLLADSALGAIDVCKRHPGDIALVMLDLSMPHMSGDEALPELRKLRPGVKVLVSSGYSESETMTLFKGQTVSGFIQKPYTGTSLAEKVKACLM